MIKFEEHEGQLFRMLEEPKFLEPGDSEPFLIRLIADDSRMGKYNRGMYSKKELSTKYVLELVSLGACVMVSSGNLDSIDCYQYEIIGYPVEEGSKDWALYQMMQGNKVCNPTLAAEKATHLGSYEVEQFNTFWYIVGDAVVEGKSNYVTLSVSSWIAASSSTGWQIYTEPKPEPAKEPIADCDNCKHRCPKRYIDHCQMYEPKPEQPKYKVGDCRIEFVKQELHNLLDKL